MAESSLRSTGSGLQVALSVDAVDILRGREAHDLLQPALRVKFLKRIREGMYDLVLAAPPCNTFSRAVYHDSHGPAPVRSREHPWGLPDLPPHLQQKLEESNLLIRFTIDSVAAALACKVKTVGVWIEFPEDLGSANCGDPASLWQLQETQALAGSAVRGAIHQCEWAEVPYAKPTGMLTNIPQIFNDPLFWRGWPELSFSSGAGRSTWTYQGPLPRSCAHGGHPSLIGAAEHGGWKTSSAAAYPPQMCLHLAAHMVSFMMDQTSGQVRCSVPPGGLLAPRCGLLLSPHDLFPTEVSELESALEDEMGLKLSVGARGSKAVGLVSGNGPASLQVMGQAGALVAINTAVDKAALRIGVPFRWSSLQLNVNVLSGWHRDPSPGVVLVLVGGRYFGGQLEAKGG